MKLRNKQTGEIGSLKPYGEDVEIQVWIDNMSKPECRYNSLAELSTEWEDYEEPKPQVAYYIDRDGEIVPYENVEYPKRVFNNEQNKEISNYFETKEEAEKAVEKLKALTKLKNCGLRFEGYNDRDRANGGDIVIYAHINTLNDNLLDEAQPEMLKDLDLLFGGEE